MAKFFKVKEAKTLLVLALPVFLAQIAQTSMGFVDTVVAGRASATDMAAVAVASSFWMPTVLFGQGLLMALTPLVAQALGAGKREGMGQFLRQGVWMALGLSLLLMSVLYAISLAVPQMKNVDPALTMLTSKYLLAILWGVPGLMLFFAQRTFLEGQGRTRPAMIAGFLGLLLNIPLNIIFVFGLYGAPAMGGVGCGVASAIVCWVMCFAMVFSVRRANPRAIRWEAFSWAMVCRIARIGLPGAFALLVETSAFAIIAILIAPLGTEFVAGHQVALNVSGLLFMIPLSLGAATTIRVGTRLGEGNLAEAKDSRITALTLSLILAAITAVLLFVLRYPIARVYTDSLPVIALAAMLLIYDALYQLSDAAQVVTMAALRGYNDTRALFVITFISYWVISLPLGYILCMTSLLTPEPLGVVGFWIGIILGITCAALLLLYRLSRLEKLSLDAVRAKINR